MGHPTGESKREELRVDFDRRLKLEFHGSKITSDDGISDAKTVAEGSLERGQHDETKTDYSGLRGPKIASVSEPSDVKAGLVRWCIGVSRFCATV